MTLAAVASLLSRLSHRNNRLTTCLQYFPGKCHQLNKFNDGRDAIGSQLTLADLSFNRIEFIDSLAHHPFLETLILSNNNIQSISGLQGLKFLKVTMNFECFYHIIIAHNTSADRFSTCPITKSLRFKDWSIFQSNS